MAILCVLALVYFLTLQVLASGANVDFLRHLKRIRSLPCKEPQMRALKVSELIRNGSVDKKFLPEMTVLHRCDAGSGCCSGGPKFTCGYKDGKDVELTFLVVDLVQPKNGDVYEKVKVRNHTLCECKEDSDIR